MLESDLKDKRIFLILQRDHGVKHGFEIAKKMNNLGVKLSTLVFKPSTENFIDFQKDIKFEYVLKNSDIENNCENINKENNYNIELLLNDFQINSIWETAFTLRGVSNSFKKYPFSFEQNLSDQEIENYIVAFGFKIKELINNFKPDYVIGYNLGDIRHLLINKITNIKKIPFFFMSDTKIKNMAAFYYDLNCEKSFFLDRVKKLNNKKITSKNREKAIKYIEEQRINGIKQPNQINNISLNKSIVNFNNEKIFIKKLLYYFKYLSLKSSSDNQNISTIIRNYFCEKISIYKNKRIKYDQLDKIKKFVFFPLQHYPESQLGMINTVHDNQLNNARILARFLPRNLTLAVKNHPWMYERRTASLLEKFKNTPNVKLLDHRIPNEFIYKKMDYMISLSGTSIFEAAILKKPSIQIGSLKMMNKLPNFFQLEKLEDISSIISFIDDTFYKNLNLKEYDENLINYISAAYDIGFELTMYEKDLKNDNKALEYMWSYYLKEIGKINKLITNFNY